MQDLEHVSGTAFKSDNYSEEYVHKEWSPDGWTHLIKGHACYDPAKVCRLCRRNQAHVMALVPGPLSAPEGMRSAHSVPEGPKVTTQREMQRASTSAFRSPYSPGTLPGGFIHWWEVGAVCISRRPRLSQPYIISTQPAEAHEDASLACLLGDVQDLVIPAFLSPGLIGMSPLLGYPAQERTHLLFFRGDVGQTRLPMYSRGIRQRLHSLAHTNKWHERHDIVIAARDEVEGDYAQHLSSSKFCLVAPGGTWPDGTAS